MLNIKVTWSLKNKKFRLPIKNPQNIRLVSSKKVTFEVSRRVLKRERKISRKHLKTLYNFAHKNQIQRKY